MSVLPGFQPPTSGQAATQAPPSRLARVGAAFSRSTAAVRSRMPGSMGSECSDASGSFQIGSLTKTPTKLWPQTPSPAATLHPYFWSSGSIACQGSGRFSTAVPASVKPTDAASVCPAVAAAPSQTAQQMVWVQMPLQMAVPVQGSVMVMPANGQGMANTSQPVVADESRGSCMLSDAAKASAAEAQPTTTGNLPVLLGRNGQIPSVGSKLHSTGQCQPCAWFWKPGRGCTDGANCDHCHLCPEGELRARKKAKLLALRMGVLEPSADVNTGARRSHLKLSQLVRAK